MGAEGIAGHKDLVLLDVGIDGIRPVQIRYRKEAQGPVADLHLLSVGHRDPHEVPVYDLPQEAQGAGGSKDLKTRIVFQKALDAAGMIRLRMVHHQIVDG